MFAKTMQTRYALFGYFYKRTTPLHRLFSASLLEDKYLIVHESNGKELKFPAVWLRDNCQCPKCFHADTASRIIYWKKRSEVAARIADIQALDNNTISINWCDKHSSTFDLTWLRKRNFTKENRERLVKKVYKPEPLLWSKQDFPKVSQTLDFKDVIAEDKVLLGWLEALARQGFAIIKNSPHQIDVVRQLASRIGFIKRTTYGEIFEVISKRNTTNYAYLMTPLQLHTDMPYYEYKPGINILHYLVQSESKGGANLMTDGFYIAEQMRQKYPKEYEILRKTPVDWSDVGNDNGMSFNSLCRTPVICLDADGRLQRINHNVTKRDSHFNMPLEQVEPWYEAYGLFLELINDEAVEFKISAGDVLTFNNLRMLHGRTAYVDSPTNQRHLLGAYVDWDLIYSKIRILKTQLNV